jgi:DNA-binding NtrC family response regulator
MFRRKWEIAVNNKKSILLVDSDREFSGTIKKMFQEYGYAVSTVYDGIKALRLLAEAEFDLIISELVIPKLDGIELMEEINRRRINVPVIFLTAKGEIESYMDVMNMGAFDYLHKPAKETEILKIVKKAFETTAKSRISVG